MKKNIFAVCDLEVDYAFNFMDYLNQKKNLPFEIQAFTTAASLIASGKENHIESLLISDKAMRKEVRDLGIGKIIILSEGVHPPELDQYSSVYKYQSSSDVIREVMACYGEEKSLDPVTFPVVLAFIDFFILGVLIPNFILIASVVSKNAPAAKYMVKFIKNIRHQSLINPTFTLCNQHSRDSIKCFRISNSWCNPSVHTGPTV